MTQAHCFAQSLEATEFCEEQTEIHAIPCKPQHKHVITSEATNNYFVNRLKYVK